MYLLIRLDPDKRFAIPGEKVEKVLDHSGVIVLPRMVPAATGVVRYQDFLIPVYDFRRLFPDWIFSSILLPHLIVFRGAESLNAFPAEALEGITAEVVSVEAEIQHPFLQPYDLSYQGLRCHQFRFSTIERHLNIP